MVLKLILMIQIEHKLSQNFGTDAYEWKLNNSMGPAQIVTFFAAAKVGLLLPLINVFGEKSL